MKPKVKVKLPLGYTIEWWGWSTYASAYIAPLKIHLTDWSTEVGVFFSPWFAFSIDFVIRKNHWAKRGIYIDAELLGFKLEHEYEDGEKPDPFYFHRCGECVHDTDKFCSHCGEELTHETR